MDRPRNKNGTFKSAFDAALDNEEAKWNAEIKAKMQTGMSFDEAWVAAGGQIISIADLEALARANRSGQDSARRH